MEAEMLEPFELALGGREKLLGLLTVPIHRAADAEKQQNFHRTAALRTALNVDVIFVGGGAHPDVKIELLCRPFARKPTQTARRDPDIARTRSASPREILELAGPRP